MSNNDNIIEIFNTTHAFNNKYNIHNGNWFQDTVSNKYLEIWRNNIENIHCWRKKVTDTWYCSNNHSHHSIYDYNDK